MKRRARVTSTAGAAIAWIAAFIIVAWFIGRIFTDRYLWSQWFWWIPTPALLPVIVLGMLGSLRPARDSRSRRRRLRRWAAGGFALLVYFSFIEHRFFHSAPQIPANAPAVKIMHWNAQPATWTVIEPTIDRIIAVDADIVILTNPGGMFGHERAQAWIADKHTHHQYPFAIISRSPIRSVRPLVAANQMFATLVEVEGDERFGRSIQLLLVDLPSSLGVHRMEVARRMRAMLDQRRVPPPDVAVADFNIPRGSASLNILFPGMINAYDQAGYGYGATYHRRWPLQHLDQILLSPNVCAVRYDITDPGVSRHRAQIVWIESMDNRVNAQASTSTAPATDSH